VIALGLRGVTTRSGGGGGRPPRAAARGGGGPPPPSLGIRASEVSSGRAARDLLTAREHEVLRLLARGRSNDEIAAELVLSVRTVESHIASVYRKIGASGRTARAAATAYALSNGLG
jgi:DNA-binding NarL/FixJ family response regulator